MSTNSRPKRWIKKLKDGLKSGKSSKSDPADITPQETSRTTVDQASVPQRIVVESSPSILHPPLTPVQPLLEVGKSPIIIAPTPRPPLASTPVAPVAQEIKKSSPVSVIPPKSTPPAEVHSLDSLLASHGFRETYSEPRPTTIDEALCYAVQNWKQSLVEELLRRGAQVRTSTGPWLSNSALHVAIAKRQNALALRLMDTSPSEIDTRSKKLEKTPLSLACEKGLTDLASELLNRGANLETRDYLGRTPLQQAARSGYLETVTFLLGRGAVVGARDNQGRSAQDRAGAGSHYATFDTLQRATDAARLWGTTRKPRHTRTQDKPEAQTVPENQPSTSAAHVQPRAIRAEWTTSTSPGHIEVQAETSKHVSGTDWDDGFSVIEYKFIKDEVQKGISPARSSGIATDTAAVRDGSLQTVPATDTRGSVEIVQGSDLVHSSEDKAAPHLEDCLVVGVPNSADRGG